MFKLQKICGSIRLNHFELKKTFTFLDYIMSGTQINCTFAIDFTGKSYKYLHIVYLFYFTLSTGVIKFNSI